MSLPDDTLRKILIQIQQTAVQSRQALNTSMQQASVKERDRRMLQLTIEEIGAIKGDVNLYKGVGKMFMMVPRKEMEKDLKDQEKELSDDITSLNKKSKYLEKQFNDAQAQLRDIVRSSCRFVPKFQLSIADTSSIMHQSSNSAVLFAFWFPFVLVLPIPQLVSTSNFSVLISSFEPALQQTSKYLQVVKIDTLQSATHLPQSERVCFRAI
ncbi:Prefoldin [Favolaschia claudopus]|uniref:Prefoldin n=1 Tax=Favolaschia claudopus TaxID=2862362 RepID=A0AAW0EEK8_9AGAR